MDESLYRQFVHNIMRQGDAKALENLCLALGVAPGLFPYLHRWWQVIDDAHTREYEDISIAWEKIWYVQSCWLDRGVDQVFWKCTCWHPAPTVAWLRFFPVPPVDEGGL